jgi:hypothetical protein
MKFDVRYYLIAILFIIFDLEIAFVFPWAVVFATLGVFGLIEMGMFLGFWCSASSTSGRRERSNGSEPNRRNRADFAQPDADRGRLTTSCAPAPTIRCWSAASSPPHGCAGQLGAHRFDVADDLRSGLLRGGDDARRRRAPGSRPLRRGVPPVAAPVRRDDRGRHPGQQDGAGAAQGLRPDARAEVGHLDGFLRQRRRLLPLFLFGGARLRPHRAGRRLRAGLSADRRSADLRHPAIAEEDPRTNTFG